MNMAHDGVGKALSRRFRPYPAYKDSGVEWLGQIPAHWALCRLKFILQEPLHYGANEPAEQVDEDLPRYIRITDISDDGRLRGETFRSIPEAVAKPHLLQDGDILFARSGATVGKTFRYESRWGRAAHAGYLIRARLDRQACSSRFVQFFTASQSYWNWMRSNFIQATIQNVSAERYGDLQIPIPKPREQQAIVNHLYEETAKIDRLVARKERLIELLEEKRNALITNAVTRGLDPNVPMKDSGLAWLGQIPAQWEVNPLKRAIMFQRGHDLPSHERGDGSVPVISSSGPSSTHSHALGSAPGIVTGRYGTIGNFYLITEDYWPLNTTLYSIDLRNNDPKFLLYMLRSLSPLFVVSAIKSAVPGVDRKDIHSAKTAIPPLVEQRAIANYLDCEMNQIEALITKITKAIDLLIEFRSALISAAVTGKIDVRGAVPR